MTLQTTPASITKVGSDRGIALPDEMLVGATVAVIVVPTGASSPEDAARRIRFAETFSAIRAATAQGTTPPEISDSNLDTLIETACKAPQA